MQTKCTPAERAAEYLERIAVLTGAKQDDDGTYRSRPKSPFSLKLLHLQSRDRKPSQTMLTVLFSLRDCFRSRAVLQAEILALRHQLLVLQRSSRGRNPKTVVKEQAGEA